MSEIIKFEFDQPVEVSLRFTEPRVFASQFPGGDDRHMFSTTDGRVMYVSPLVSARIKALQVEQGECFYIVKRKSGRLTEFAVSREPIAGGHHFGGHKKTFPVQKTNLPERLYYSPEKELSPAAVATLEQQLAAGLSYKAAERALPLATFIWERNDHAVSGIKPLSRHFYNLTVRSPCVESRSQELSP